MKLWIPCIVCGRKATWSYMPSNDNYCEGHVPKGCSCSNKNEPCCEYSKILPEFHDDPEIVWNGWEDYYAEHPEERDDTVEEPKIRQRTRRTRIKDSRTEQENKRYYENGHARGGNSKPKHFKPRSKKEVI